MEKSLDASINHELCATALSSLGTGTVITDQYGTILYVNKSFEEITGYQAFEAIGQKMSLLKSGYQSKEFYAELWRSIQEHGQWKGTLWNKRKNGEIYHERLNIRRFTNDSGKPCYVGTFSDISEQDELQRALIDAQKRELMVTMIGGIAHNFNNYMAAIQGLTYLGGKSAKDEKIKHYFSEISSVTVKNAHLVQKLMNISRPARNDHTPTNLADIVKQSIETELSVISESIEIIEHLPGEDDCWTQADPTDIEQVLLNLINNARDALKNTTNPKIVVGVHPSIKKLETCIRHWHCPRANNCPVNTEKSVIIEVEDNGMGIPEEMHDKVFTPFFTTKDPDKGTGLGLASVSQVVNRLGGAIWLTSKVNVGTRFTMCLPRVDNPAFEASDSESKIYRGA